MLVRRNYVLNTAPPYTGLTTAGYTLFGSPAGSAWGGLTPTPVGTRQAIAEQPTGSGVYPAAPILDPGFSGTIVFDTGGSAPRYVAEAINPGALGPAGLDAIQVEAGVNARQALSPILAACAGTTAGLGTGTVQIFAGANPGTQRISSTGDENDNRIAVTLALPE